MAYNHLYFDTLGIEHGFLLIHTFDQLSDYIAITNYQEMGRDLCSIYINKIKDNLRGQ